MYSISIAEFCQKHRIGKTFFYKLARNGMAPETYKIGRIVRISEDAERAWVAAYTKPQKAVAA